MNSSNFLKCFCSACRGPIEFPTHGLGQEVACPHCGKSVMLSASTPRRKHRWMLWAMCLLVLAVGSMAIFAVVKRRTMAAKFEQAARLSAQGGPENLQKSLQLYQEVAAYGNGAACYESGRRCENGVGMAT